MNDPQSTSQPTIDFADFDRRHRAHLRRSEDLLQTNKIVLFDALAAAGIEVVTVTFDGVSDSGQIEDIAALADDQTLALPLDRIEIARIGWQDSDTMHESQIISEAIETLTYDLLELTHCGWENNDGAYGEFTFDVAKRTITLDYTERYTSSENSSHEF